MTTIENPRTAMDYSKLGPSQARAMLAEAAPRYTEARAELEFALLACDYAGVPTRESGPIIGRDSSTAWERIRTLRKKWLHHKLEWPQHVLDRLRSFPQPTTEEPRQN